MPEPRACNDLELTGDRLNSLEKWKANADLTIWQLTGQVAELREAQKQLVAERYRFYGSGA